jgi:opacity protein-like surface antigen
MKTLIKPTLLAAAFAVIGTSAALASDSQNEQRLAMQRQAAAQQSTTVAVYAGHQGVIERQYRDQPAETRLETRTNARGQEFRIYVPVE